MSAEYINSLADQVNNATNCDSIQLFVDQHVAAVTNLINSQVQSISSITSQWAGLVSLPSDPLQILSWASKVVGGPIAAQVALIAQTAIEMAQTAAALANLAGAVANAASKLTNCLEDAIIGTMDDIINDLLSGAGTLISNAESIKNDLVAKVVPNELVDIAGLTDGVNNTLTNTQNVIDGISG